MCKWQQSFVIFPEQKIDTLKSSSTPIYKLARKGVIFRFHAILGDFYKNDSYCRLTFIFIIVILTITFKWWQSLFYNYCHRTLKSSCYCLVASIIFWKFIVIILSSHMTSVIIVIVTCHFLFMPNPASDHDEVFSLNEDSMTAPRILQLTDLLPFFRNGAKGSDSVSDC